MRIGVRRTHDQPAVERTARQRVDGRHLQCLLDRQVGQQPRQALGQQRLADTRRACQREMVPTGGRHLQRVPGLVLAHHVGQVLHSPRVGGPRAGRFRLRVGLTAQQRDQVDQAGHPGHVDPLDQPCLAQLRGGHHGADQPRAAALHECGQHPTHAAYPAVEPQLAEEHRRSHRLQGNHARGGEHRGRYRKVVVRAGLGQVGRGEVDRHRRGRPAEPGRRDGRPAALPGLLDRGVGAADDHRARQPTAHRDLDLDGGDVDADQRHRPRLRESHGFSRFTTCRTELRPLASTSTPTASNRTGPTRSSCERTHSMASSRSRLTLAYVIDSSGSP